MDGATGLHVAFGWPKSGQSGLPLYVDETTPHHGSHIKGGPYSPQWQRKLEVPIRVLLSCINRHPDFSDQHANIVILSVMKPCERRQLQEHHIAWARLLYSTGLEGLEKGTTRVPTGLYAKNWRLKLRAICYLLQSSPYLD